MEQGDRTFEALLNFIREENERVLAKLRAECDFDGMSPAKQGSRYTAEIGSTPIAGALHLARKGKLADSRLRGWLKTPETLFEVAAKVGIRTEDEKRAH